ncbi:UDP-N-acetylmuramoyl-tripeptide--D-alanyl-D-alanine ligase [Cellvibrio zantedeschiae]|uniref:UDP-N-acetylmuramoyl-tripeptide--D-alanyl-D-alanine ligase n=1 Tax=Cellvibrio zantedeschiae TaxID=1237077 RepID=A0ABQ3ASK2_9GAMM|nr:UDP-N-acetylmuramoyl-tripeptide--D-alanyl-D-alanine ligase [Cellvibrio zantedeschiae]GGY62744.1 UDP-N-acetylmuramoyl-tripeptide--D-alanyl-D-alanine ligase [Cellvibrio zantedeschiae]
MIAPLTLTQVAEYCRNSLNAEVHNGDVAFTNVNTDTRTLVAGDLFVALRGENFDAHNFLQQAAAKNVCGLVVEKFDPSVNLPQLIVKDTLLALGQIAAMNRNAFNKPVLAITGSSGKTTVKTMLADILRECGDVHATKGNLNNHIGVPLTLLQLNANHDFAVIEMGASAIGEIEYLCSLARPQVTMINNVMPAHIAGFGSIEGVAKAKGEIYQGLTSADIAVVNIDDKFSAQWLVNLNAPATRVSLHNTQADCYSEKITFSADSVAFDLVIHDKKIPVSINALGEHSVRNALMAAAMAHAVGASLESIKQGLGNFSAVGGRMSRHIGTNQSLIIDDSYNANPGSVRVAIDVLAARNGKRILVLGDLAELGANAESLHAQLGAYAKQQNIDHFYTLGVLTKHASESFGSQVDQHHFVERDLLIAALKKQATPDTTILIKGSRSAKMDLVVSALCSSGENH